MAPCITNSKNVRNSGTCSHTLGLHWNVAKTSSQEECNSMWQDWRMTTDGGIPERFEDFLTGLQHVAGLENDQGWRYTGTI
eukprot:1186942-Prorocentrum_minimum.AAC.5